MINYQFDLLGCDFDGQTILICRINIGFTKEPMASRFPDKSVNGKAPSTVTENLLDEAKEIKCINFASQPNSCISKLIQKKT